MMILAKGTVVSISAKREEQKAKAAFLDLLHADIGDNPDRIEPIPASLFDRMARIRAQAEKNRERRASTELLEG